MNPLATVRRARRGILSFLDELGAALGEESAVNRLFTIHNELVSVTACIEFDPLVRDAGYRLSWHTSSADQVVRASGGLNNLQTPDEARKAWTGVAALWLYEANPSHWRNELKRRLADLQPSDKIGLMIDHR